MKTNKDLELYIYNLRMDIGQKTFDTDELINAYFLSAVLLFNNIKKVEWIDNPVIDYYIDYFSTKMNFKFDGNIHNSINSLLKLWHTKKVVSIESNLRGLQFLLRNIKGEFSEDILNKVVEFLEPIEKLKKSKL